MSTKIYNGYKLPYMPINKLQELMHQLREDFSVQAKEILYELLAERMTLLVDNITIKGLDSTIQQYKDRDNFNLSRYESIYFSAFWFISKEHELIERNNEHNPRYDFGCELVLFSVGRKTLVLFYGENERYKSLWNSYDFVKDYHYQSQTEKPDEISDQEWSQRESDWEKALYGPGIPAQSGFIVKLVSSLPIPTELDWEKIISHIPSVDKRAASYAQATLFNEKRKSYNKEVDCSEWYKDYSEFITWLETDDGKKALMGKTEEIKQVLKPSFTAEYFEKTKLSNIQQ